MPKYRQIGIARYREFAESRWVARESVDLVLVDVQMPEMDALEATRAIRERERDGARVSRLSP